MYNSRTRKPWALIGVLCLVVVGLMMSPLGSEGSPDIAAGPAARGEAFNDPLRIDDLDAPKVRREVVDRAAEVSVEEPDLEQAERRWSVLNVHFPTPLDQDPGFDTRVELLTENGEPADVESRRVGEQLTQVTNVPYGKYWLRTAYEAMRRIDVGQPVVDIDIERSPPTWKVVVVDSLYRSVPDARVWIWGDTPSDSRFFFGSSGDGLWIPGGCIRRYVSATREGWAETAAIRLRRSNQGTVFLVLEAPAVEVDIRVEGLEGDPRAGRFVQIGGGPLRYDDEGNRLPPPERWLLSDAGEVRIPRFRLDRSAPLYIVAAGREEHLGELRVDRRNGAVMLTRGGRVVAHAEVGALVVQMVGNNE